MPPSSCMPASAATCKLDPGRLDLVVVLAPGDDRRGRGGGTPIKRGKSEWVQQSHSNPSGLSETMSPTPAVVVLPPRRSSVKLSAASEDAEMAPSDTKPVTSLRYPFDPKGVKMASTMNPLKIEVGISMLAETRDWEFAAAHALLKKILGNVLANPAEPKFRTLRTSNAKLAPLFATRGVKALLRGAGFAEEADFLSLDAAAPTDGVHLALSQLEAHAVARAERAEAAKVQEASERKAMAEEGQEKRKLMRTQIEEDAAARKEPGWTAKAAGVKGGKAITSCADIGAQGGGG